MDKKNTALLILVIIAAVLFVLMFSLLQNIKEELIENNERVEQKEYEPKQEYFVIEKDAKEAGSQDQEAVIEEARSSYERLIREVYDHHVENEILYWIDTLNGVDPELEKEFEALLESSRDEEEQNRQDEDGADVQIVRQIEEEEYRYDDVQVPVDAPVFSSPFGPRLQASEGYRYDFHRGVDFEAETGTPVYAIADGEVYRTYYEEDSDNPYPDGGTVVVLRHYTDTPIIFHGEEYTTYYSLYMHLDTITIENTTEAPYMEITKGTQIGTVGETGTTVFEHLHFEIRVGTTCSMEYQRENPTASCGTFFDEPIDPHVNPLLFLPYDNANSLEVEILDENPVTLLITSDREELDYNRAEIMLNGRSEHVDLNLRDGIDVENIDNNQYGGIEITPRIFNSETELYEITIVFLEFDDFDEVEVTDVWGNGIRIEK